MHGALVAEAVKDCPVADAADRVHDRDHSHYCGDRIPGQVSAHFLGDAACLPDQNEAGTGQERDPDIIQPEGACAQHL